MKKFLVVLIVLFLTVACSQDNQIIDTDSNLIGTWRNSEIALGEDLELEEGEYLYTKEFQFYNNDSFKWLTYLMNKESEEIIGYLAMNEGTFSTENNRITINFNSYYSNEEFLQEFNSMEELVLIHENQEERFDYSLNEMNNILIFDFDPCEPNAFCFEQIQLEKIE